ncbi:MAG: electron transfer flavoprotein subunit alpha/FixB family protein [Arenicella sp.]
MTILVIAEHDNQQLKAATLNTLTAANELSTKNSGEISILIAGEHCSDVAEQAKFIPGVSSILLADNQALAQQLPENLAPIIVDYVSKNDVTHILAPATTQGKNVLPRVAALLDVAQVSDIVAVVDADTFVRPIYAGNALETVRSSDAIKVATVRTSTFDALEVTTGGQATIEALTDAEDSEMSRFITEQISVSDRPELASARIVVSGGRGLKSGENFSLLESLADKMGAAVGASRAAVDAGYVPNDMQVGQTGKIVSPDLYIAVGISGAIQHLAGMKDSKVIVAINEDAEAPIFNVADYGLVADLFEAVPELEASLN